MNNQTFADPPASATFLTAVELEKIAQEVEKEFPEDPALQGVYIARQIIAQEAEQLGMDYFVYVRQLAEKIKKEEGIYIVS